MEINKELIIEALQEYYAGHGNAKSIEYAYGFFDALAIVQNFKEEK